MVVPPPKGASLVYGTIQEDVKAENMGKISARSKKGETKGLSNRSSHKQLDDYDYNSYRHKSQKSSYKQMSNFTDQQISGNLRTLTAPKKVTRRQQK